MLAELENESADKTEKSIESLKVELSKIRTGRAQVSMLEAVKVN